MSENIWSSVKVGDEYGFELKDVSRTHFVRYAGAGGDFNPIHHDQTFAEKAGCYVNYQGRLQYAGATLPPRDGSLPDLDLLAILLERQQSGPIASRPILEEAAEIVEGLAAVRGGEVPEFGLVLSGEEPTEPAMPEYVDPWHAPRGRPTLAVEVST